MTRLDRSSHSSASRWITAVSFVCLTVFASAAFGQTNFVPIIFDGFGDGDIDGNGIALEETDTSQGSYRPGAYDPIDLATGQHAGTGPRIPSLQQEVDGGTLTLDPSDTGISWFGSAGFGSSGVDDARSRLTVVHDTTAAVPVDVDDPFSRFPETLGAPDEPTAVTTAGLPSVHIPALNNGLALGYEAAGGGNSATGFFGQTIGLGDALGDQLRVGFDFRIWNSSPNDPSTNNITSDPTPPTAGELRFGIYEDTDDQLGTVNPTAGSGNSPAIWGEEPGDFRGASPGAGGDNGFFVEVQVGDVANPPLPFFPGGETSRIREEANPVGDRFLQGSGNDTFASPPSSSTDPFPALNNTDLYRVELTLERALITETIDMVDVEFEGIIATLDLTNLATMETVSLSGDDSLRDRDGDGVIDDVTNFSVDEFDYFAIRNTGTTDDWDFILDNFTVELAGSNAPSGLNCDADGGSSCDISDLDALYAAFGTSGGQFDFSDGGAGTVGPEDILGWLAEASSSANTANPNGVTYVVGDTNLDGLVNSTDLGLLLNDFGSSTNVGWGQGDLDGSGDVNSSDLGMLLNNFGFSSAAAAAAVPEPASGFMLTLATLALLCVRRRQ